MNDTTSSVADQAHMRASMRKVALTALAGTSIEWYDFFLYATAAALVFPAAFFPGSDPTIALVLSFGTFAFGFIARPLGGIVFGVLAQIPLVPCLGDLLRDFGTLHRLHLMEFIFQILEAFSGVVGNVRHGV